MLSGWPSSHSIRSPNGRVARRGTAAGYGASRFSAYSTASCVARPPTAIRRTSPSQSAVVRLVISTELPSWAAR